MCDYRDWQHRIAAKDNVAGRSAVSLARAWAGPLAVAATLARRDELTDFRLEDAAVELQTSFDRFPGGRRNHDLLLRGGVPGGGLVVSVESKADESFGETVGEYIDRAARKAQAGERTNAPARLDGLVAAFARVDSAPDSLRDLRYQLLSGVAGAVAAAADYDAVYAVFLVHEFVTDGLSETKRSRNASDLRAFARSVFGRELPKESEPVWCEGPLPFKGDDDRLPARVQLYLAKTTTDWQARG